MNIEIPCKKNKKKQEIKGIIEDNRFNVEAKKGFRYMRFSKLETRNLKFETITYFGGEK